MSGSSQPSQASFSCKHCHKAIFIPVGLPATTAPCPHCGKEVTSPDQRGSSEVSPFGADPNKRPVNQPVQKENDAPIRLETSAASSAGKASDKPGAQSATKPELSRQQRGELEELVAPSAEAGSENQRRSKGSKAAVMSAVLILFVAAGVTFWLAQKWKQDKQAGSGNDVPNNGEVSEAAWKGSGWKQEATKVLSGFMSAKSPIDRMKYVIPNDGVMEELEMYYPEGVDDSDTPIESFGHIVSSPEDQERGIYLMQYRQPMQIDIRDYFAPIGTLDKVMGQEASTFIEMAHRIDQDNLSKPVGINAFFKKTDQGLKLDASVFIQGKKRTFRAFVDYAQPGKSKVFRVMATESLSHELRDDPKYRTYRLVDFAYPRDFVNIPVLVDSEVGKILSDLNWRGMNRARVPRTATIELGWTKESPSKLRIVRVVCWEFLGVGGEIGNTKR